MELLSLIVALVVGFAVAWLIAWAKRAQALAEAQTQARAEIAALKERLQLREQEIAEFRPRQAAWETKETESGNGTVGDEGPQPRASSPNG